MENNDRIAILPVLDKGFIEIQTICFNIIFTEETSVVGFFWDGVSTFASEIACPTQDT
jgi:hypothetical protein